MELRVNSELDAKLELRYGEIGSEQNSLLYPFILVSLCLKYSFLMLFLKPAKSLESFDCEIASFRFGRYVFLVCLLAFILGSLNAAFMFLFFAIYFKRLALTLF